MKKTPEIIDLLEDLLEGETAGDPMSGRKWLRRDLRQLSQDLKQRGVTASHVTVRRLLQAQKYSLKAIELRSAKGVRKERSESGFERNRQFRSLERVKP